MKLHQNTRPIVISLIAIGFFVLIKWQFPVYKVKVNAVPLVYSRADYVVVSRIHSFDSGDVVIFEHQGELLMSRVVGMPKDELVCIDARMMRNGNLIQSGLELYEYHLYCDSSYNQSLIPSPFTELYPNREYTVILTDEQFEGLVNDPGVEKIEQVIHPLRKLDGDRGNWTRDNFGPLLIKDKSVFLVNDNWTNSADSRSFGVISMDDVIGKVIYKL